MDESIKFPVENEFGSLEVSLIADSDGGVIAEFRVLAHHNFSMYVSAEDAARIGTALLSIAATARIKLAAVA